MPHTSARILVVEDEQAIRELIAFTLEVEGYHVFTAGNGMEAFERFSTDKPDLVVLDLMMPSISGLEVLQQLRERSTVPVLILSALATEENRVRGLQLGADDYLVKPFSPRELVARIQALLRRAGMAVPNSKVTVGPVTIDLGSREVFVRDEPVETTAKEFDLLAFLARNPGRVYTRHQLLREVWNSSSEWQQEGTVTEHVRRLRVKIEEDPENPRLVQTVRGVGYRFERRQQRTARDEPSAAAAAM